MMIPNFAVLLVQDFKMWICRTIQVNIPSNLIVTPSCAVAATAALTPSIGTQRGAVITATITQSFKT